MHRHVAEVDDVVDHALLVIEELVVFGDHVLDFLFGGRLAAPEAEEIEYAGFVLLVSLFAHRCFFSHPSCRPHPRFRLNARPPFAGGARDRTCRHAAQQPGNRR